MKTSFQLAVLLCAASLLAQQPAATEKVNVVLVEVPVHVVDREGNAVSGLTAQQFELLDDGKKRAITNFEAIDLNAPVARREEFRMSPAARRNFLLIFDLTFSSPGTIERATEAAREFVRRGMAERDLAGIATVSVERGLDWIASFTTDRRMLLQAIDAVGSGKRLVQNDPLALSLLVPEITPGTTPQSSGNAVKAEVLETQREIARGAIRANEEGERARLRRQFDHFMRLGRVLDRIAGTKQVIFLSEGFDARLLQGRGNNSSADDNADFAASVAGEVWKIDNDQRFGNTAATNVLSEMAAALRRSDVVLHSFDIKGLRTEVDAREGHKSNSNEALFLMANPTGGQVFKNSNDMGENFSRMLRQQRHVYVLGFQIPQPGTPGKFHELKVRLRDVPGARVHHRTGYFEPSPESTNIERTLSAVEILMNDIPQDEVKLELMAAPFPAEIGNPQIPVVVEIAGPTLMAGAKGDTIDGEILIYAFDQDYALRDFLYQKVGFDLSKVRDRLGRRGVKYYGALNLPAGDYEVKTLVRVGQTGRTGFAKIPLRVPDFSKTQLLNPFVVAEDADWVMVKSAPRRPAEVEYPFTIASETFVPSVTARMTSTGDYEVALFGYHLEAEGMELKARVRDGSGAEQPANVTLLGRTPSGAEGPTKLLFQFKPAGLAAGSYALDFHVRAKGQADLHRVSVPFIIQ